jgi:hypothetical protein
MREATEIELQPNDINRQAGSSLKLWKPIIHSLKERKKSVMIYIGRFLLSVSAAIWQQHRPQVAMLYANIQTPTPLPFVD